MNAYPFSLFKRVDRACFSVSFKNANGKYLLPVSTGKKTETEAMQVAFQMLRDGIPQNKKAVTVQDLSFKNMMRNINFRTQAEVIFDELRRLGSVKGYMVKETPQAEDFISLLTTFWDWEISPYIKEKLRKNHGIHKRHCKQKGQAITLYWVPFFKGRFLGDIMAMDIDAFITHMGEKDLSASRKNVVIKAGTKPLRWAFSKGKIEKDPTRGLDTKFKSNAINQSPLHIMRSTGVGKSIETYAKIRNFKNNKNITINHINYKITFQK